MRNEGKSSKNGALVALGVDQEKLAGLPTRLCEQLREILAARRSPSTREAYLNAWTGFAVWCRAMGREAFPASAETVAGYLAELHSKGIAKVTIARVLTVLRLLHSGEADPTASPLVLETWRGIKRRDRRPARRAPIVSLADLVAMCETLAKRTSELATRDRAMLAVGWAAATRSSELVALDWRDAREVAQGIELHIRSSKTDQEGRGELVALPLYREQLAAACPVRALRELRELTGGGDQVAIFPRSGFGAARSRVILGTRAHREAVGRAVKRAARFAKLPGEYSSHSLRRGFATSAAGAGIEDRLIMQHGRWRSRAVLDGYIQRGKLWTDNPLLALTAERSSPPTADTN